MKPVFFAAALLTVVSSAKPVDYTVHEWGTFTSVQGSDGSLQEGLWREEEALPEFVQGRGACTNPKCADFFIKPNSPMSVNQKMETPVLYFYAKQKMPVSVTVDFPEGLITQYYPEASREMPPRGQVEAIKNGSTTWNLEISTDALVPPPTPAESIWNPAREVAANSIRVKDQNEKFIFYRGLGKFDVPLKVKSDADDLLSIINGSGQEIASLFVLNLNDGRGEIRPLGSLKRGEELKAPDPGGELG